MLVPWLFDLSIYSKKKKNELNLYSYIIIY